MTAVRLGGGPFPMVLEACDDCGALTRAEEVRKHREWHAQQERDAQERTEQHWETWHQGDLT